jgi:hypothetical protein
MALRDVSGGHYTWLHRTVQTTVWHCTSSMWVADIILGYIAQCRQLPDTIRRLCKWRTLYLATSHSANNCLTLYVVYVSGGQYTWLLRTVQSTAWHCTSSMWVADIILGYIAQCRQLPDTTRRLAIIMQVRYLKNFSSVESKTKDRCFI